MRGLAIVSLVLLAAGCTHGLKEGVYKKAETAYRVTAPGEGWSELSLAENDVAFTSEASAHTIAVNSTCEGHEDPPLDVLIRHLLFGFGDAKTVSSEKLMLDGREALRSRVSAKLDGVPVELDLAVTKKDGCVYDFSYVSPAGKFDEKRDAFEKILADFKVERSG